MERSKNRAAGFVTALLMIAAVAGSYAVGYLAFSRRFGAPFPFPGRYRTFNARWQYAFFRHGSGVEAKIIGKDVFPTYDDEPAAEFYRRYDN